MTDKEPLKIKFIEGAFDDFDGTQEELDEIVKNITDFIQSDEFAEILANHNAENHDFLEEEHEVVINPRPTIH